MNPSRHKKTWKILADNDPELARRRKDAERGMLPGSYGV